VQTGDTIKVIEGPLAGLYGTFQGSSEQGRLLVVVELEGRPVDIEMNLGWVAATSPKRKSASSFSEPENKRLGSA